MDSKPNRKTEKESEVHALPQLDDYPGAVGCPDTLTCP